MPLTPKPGEEKLVVRVSVSVNDTDYGADLHYSSLKYVVDKDSPRPPAMQATTDIQNLIYAAFSTSQVKPLMERIEEAALGIDNPEAPGPGYDAQTRRTDGP